MLYVLLCSFILIAAYLVNMTYISVFYHRGLTHRAVEMRPWLKTFVVRSGPWVTGLDPKSWCCMHRMHHLFSDTIQDPHSPLNVGVIGVLKAQYLSYSKTMAALLQGKQKYLTLVRDLDFPVNWLSRRRLWYLPYLLHGAVGILIGWYFNAWFLGACYFLGLLSHPLQGWLVNSFGHRFGYRNFNLSDNSRNNLLVSCLALGEGYQNNHHRSPQNAKFGVKWWELDIGFLICRLLVRLSLIHLREEMDWPDKVKSQSSQAA